jgi:tetratricopeptide (TPR) repeat protein
MRLGRLLFFFFAGAASALAADVAQLLAEARAAEAKLDSRRALELYLAADQAKPNDPAILQKIARQYSDSTLDTADLVEQKKLCDLALSYAKRAHALAPKNAVNVLSLAICYAKIGFYADNKTKIANSRLVKDYAVAALALDPDYSYAHHVLGQWHHEVASISGTTRFFVRLIYGGLPAASTAEGVQHLRRAVALDPQNPSHHAELGFALRSDGQTGAAQQNFTRALELPPRDKHDLESQARARAALNRS